MRRTASVLAAACALLLATVTGATSASARTAFESGSSIWLPYWQMTTAVNSVRSQPRIFGTANLFWYDASCSTITAQSGAGSQSVIDSMHDAGLTVVPTITGGGLKVSALISCLGSSTRRTAHVNRLVTLMGSRTYDGIDIDYESFHTSDPTTASKARAAFSAFVTQLCTAVRAKGKACYITVMSRTADSSVIGGRTVPSVYDYAAIGAAATHMRIMTYDQHWSGSAPGPIAGLPWVTRVMTYAESKVPKARLELGVPAYGRDWKSTGGAKSLTSTAARALAARYGRTPRFDATQGEYTFTYTASGVKHTVWFSGRRAVAGKAALARSRGWAGACYWAAGHEEAGTWGDVRAALEIARVGSSAVAVGRKKTFTR